MDDRTLNERLTDDVWQPSGDYYGNCPICGAPGLGYDIDRTASVNACDLHRIAWHVGSVGLLKDACPEMSLAEREQVYGENRVKLRAYRFIDPSQARGPGFVVMRVQP